MARPARRPVPKAPESVSNPRPWGRTMARWRLLHAMACANRQRSALARELAVNQHGVVARRQLLGLGFTRSAIGQRLDTGRLHRVHRGVYAVGRAELSDHGRWMAAVLSAGEGAVLSHRSAGELWGILAPAPGSAHVSVPGPGGRRRADVIIHRRANLGPSEVTRRDRIPVTSVASTLIDLAAVLPARLARAVNDADRLRLIDPERLREMVDQSPRRPGVGILRALLDRRTFVLTDSELERRFLPIARRAGLPLPLTQTEVNGFRVDFFWPDLGLVVETDGLTYHRTPEQQARDRERDQVHTAAGLTCLRFTNGQVRDRSGWVEATLRRVGGRLAGR